MKNNFAVVSLVISSLLALTIPGVINPSAADADDYYGNLCGKGIVGTYLAISTSGNTTPSLTYRELLTLTADGNLIANDSNAGGVPGSSNPLEQPFGTVQGSWKCIGKNKIVATALNFTFRSGSLPANIVPGKYQLTFNPQTGTVSGNYSMNFYDINSNPLNKNTQPLPPATPTQFNYQGVKVKAK
ncbi:MAG: hypothetical protein V7K48_27490 [Nostoc sp.]|uniref:hypothetical protein n=1 Tax=Nostoc sp. TaxID=1180 RepID=UPI002FF60C44